MAAEFVLTFAAEGILTKVSSLAAQELALAWGFKAELEKLGESLSSIQDFLRGAAERPDDQGKAVEKWVKKLKQVAEDADDILDDFNYELLRRKVELHNHMKRKKIKESGKKKRKWGGETMMMMRRKMFSSIQLTWIESPRSANEGTSKMRDWLQFSQILTLC